MRTIFAQMINREIPADIIYEDELCIAINDINPQAPVHILLIPKLCIPRLSLAEISHDKILAHLMLTVTKVAQQADLTDFRIVINNGPMAGQSVEHLHLHILGGRALLWPPG